MLRLFGALLLACAAAAWGMAYFGACPAKLGFALSLMCSGLAWALVPLWSRQRRCASRDAPSDSETPVGKPTPGGKPSPSAREHALRFGLDAIAPARKNTPLVHLHAAYLDWCEAQGEKPFAPREIGAELADLFERTGIAIVDVDGVRCVSRVRIKTSRGQARTRSTQHPPRASSSYITSPAA